MSVLRENYVFFYQFFKEDYPELKKLRNYWGKQERNIMNWEDYPDNAMSDLHFIKKMALQKSSIAE